MQDRISPCKSIRSMWDSARDLLRAERAKICPGGIVSSESASKKQEDGHIDGGDDGDWHEG